VPTAHSPSVLIVRLDAIGDAVTLVPLIAALRAHDMRIGAVLNPANAEVFSKRALDRRHIVNGNLRTLASEIEARRYEYALIPTEKPAGYRIAAMAKIPHRVGFENGWGKPFKTLWIRRMCTQTVFRTAGLDPHAPHECQVEFELAQSLLPGEQPSRDPSILRQYVLDSQPQRDDRVAVQITDKWERLGVALDDVVDLARRLASSYDVRWISASNERAFGARFNAATGFDVEYFEQLAPWKEAIGASRALVAPDSGAVHIAGMIGTPVVTCFASAHFDLQTARWAPWAAPYSAIKIQEQWPLVAFDALGELFSSPSSSYKG
jgi:ADP-heptose:LPS heptosyltransferase